MSVLIGPVLVLTGIILTARLATQRPAQTAVAVLLFGGIDLLMDQDRGLSSSLAALGAGALSLWLQLLRNWLSVEFLAVCGIAMLLFFAYLLAT